MTEEIKEMLDKFNYAYELHKEIIEKHNNSDEIHIQLSIRETKQLLDYITNLQQDLDKANGIIEKDRQFYKCRMDEYADYKSRCEGTINLIDRTIEIIKQQPTKDDSWILSRLYGFKYSLNGSDEND